MCNGAYRWFGILYGMAHARLLLQDRRLDDDLEEYCHLLPPRVDHLSLPPQEVTSPCHHHIVTHNPNIPLQPDPITSNPIQSNPSPVQSSLVQSSPVQSSLN